MERSRVSCRSQKVRYSLGDFFVESGELCAFKSARLALTVRARQRPALTRIIRATVYSRSVTSRVVMQVMTYVIDDIDVGDIENCMNLIAFLY